MSRISVESNLKSKLKRLLDAGQNKSFLSEKNVICQERKLRGRILKPIEWTPTKKLPRRLKKKRKTLYSVIDELKPTDAIIPKQNYVCDVNFDGVTAQTDNHSPKFLLYKTIERLWHENLQIFIYHSDSVNFSSFIHAFPNLIAVQIKIVLPPTSDSDRGQIISAKNFIFQKNSFLKLIDSSRLDTSTHNIKFMLRSTNNEEPRAVRLPPKRPAIDIKLEESPNENKTIRIDHEQPKPLDLRTYSQDLKSSKILNRNIVNKLQRFNTVIRRHTSKASPCNNISIPKCCVTHSNFKELRVNSPESIFNEGVQLPNPKAKLMEVIEPSKFGNWQRDRVHNNTLDRSIINSKSNRDMQWDQRKTEMWIFYTSAIESFDRTVSLDELDAMPIETLYNPVEDFNLDDYL